MKRRIKGQEILMKKGLVSQETDQSFSITGRNPHEEPSNQPLMNAPHEERPSTSLITPINVEKGCLKEESSSLFLYWNSANWDNKPELFTEQFL